MKPTALITIEAFMQEFDAPDDVRTERVIERASAHIESLTGRKFKARNYNGKGAKYGSIDSEDYMFFDGPTAKKEIYLPQYPVLSGGTALTFALASLSGRTQEGDTYTTLTANVDYILDAENGIVRLTAPRTGIKVYRVTCTAGYTEIPADLEQLCLDLAGKIYSDTRTVTSESIGGWSRTYAQEDPVTQQTLSLYKRWSL
jgi:hypothetical protein